MIQVRLNVSSQVQYLLRVKYSIDDTTLWKRWRLISVLWRADPNVHRLTRSVLFSSWIFASTHPEALNLWANHT